MWIITHALYKDTEEVEFLLALEYEPFDVTIDPADGNATIWFRKEELDEIHHEQHESKQGRSRKSVTPST